MAVPGRRNGLLEDDEDDENPLFEENGLDMDLEADTPPHLRDLAAAAQRGDLNALRLALDNINGSIDEPVEDGDTALHLTCLYGYLPCVQVGCPSRFLEIVQLLLDRASNSGCLKRMLDSVDAEGDTPLHHAARGEHAEVIQLLLANGASPTKTNTYGKIPQELAEPETEAWRVLEAAASAQTTQ
ncbi:tankyrase-like [Gossypium australe]|uniref:Tankyrase-like n=1 Tax=Gossypium australe TaxID=47621 RepID=A0A5B6V7K0_9ROSI|nr:tankyrase-like [Gossypium australe]